MAAILVLAVAAGVTRYASGVNDLVAFAFATLALAGLAWVVSFATEQVGGRFGAAITGFMQSTLGNLPEFFVVIFALNAGQKVVAETAIIGSILVNALLGARAGDRGRRLEGPHRRDALQPAPAERHGDAAADVDVHHRAGRAGQPAHDPASHHTRTISIIGAIAMLLVYGLWARQYLSSADPPDEEAEEPRLSTRTAVILLALGGVGSAFVSDWFVHALEPTIHKLHISQAFAGLVIVAIAGNAVEHAVGVVLAYKGHAELAIAVVKNSVGQIAAFLYPLLVLASLLTATSLTFSLPGVYIGALFATAVIIWQITYDGEATAFEGAALVAAFVILATVAAFEG